VTDGGAVPPRGVGGKWLGRRAGEGRERALTGTRVECAASSNVRARERRGGALG